jgi:hypothetical protein
MEIPHSLLLLRKRTQFGSVFFLLLSLLLLLLTACALCLDGPYSPWSFFFGLFSICTFLLRKHIWERRYCVEKIMRAHDIVFWISTIYDPAVASGFENKKFKNIPCILHLRDGLCLEILVQINEYYFFINWLKSRNDNMKIGKFYDFDINPDKSDFPQNPDATLYPKAKLTKDMFRKFLEIFFPTLRRLTSVEKLVLNCVADNLSEKNRQIVLQQIESIGQIDRYPWVNEVCLYMKKDAHPLTISTTKKVVKIARVHLRCPHSGHQANAVVTIVNGHIFMLNFDAPPGDIPAEDAIISTKIFKKAIKEED